MSDYKHKSPVEVSLEPLRPVYAEIITQWINDREVIGNLANFKGPISVAEERKFIKRTIRSENDKMFLIYANLLGSKTPIGITGIHNIHWPSRQGRLAIIIGRKEFWGLGYAQATLRQVMAMAFNQYNLHKLWMLALERNPRTRHLNEKLGFKPEGVLRDEYFIDGKYENMVRFGMLEHEYRAMYPETSNEHQGQDQGRLQ